VKIDDFAGLYLPSDEDLAPRIRVARLRASKFAGNLAIKKMRNYGL
jgi:hypothetical protein